MRTKRKPFAVNFLFLTKDLLLVSGGLFYYPRVCYYENDFVPETHVQVVTETDIH